MDYEILNAETHLPQFVNAVCPGVNVVCPGVNGACPGVNATCDPDTNCGNNFPCENPGLGCRTGCGAPSTTTCPDIMSF